MPKYIKSLDDQLIDTSNLVKVTKKGSCLNCRDVLWLMTFIALALDSMVRININMTIVSMIVEKDSVDNDFVPECYNLTKSIRMPNRSISESDLITRNVNGYSIERKFLEMINFNFSKTGFDWNEYDQALVLGSFYWLNWVTQIPGGVLARKYGSKIVCGLSVFLPCVLSIFVPIFSYIDIRLVMVVRILQGFTEGFLWPGMHNIAAQWIPPNERGKFFTSYMGCSIGSAIFFPIFGYIMAWTSWEWVYHFCALIGIVWYMCWLYLIYDSPEKHPRIDVDEREYIEGTLADTLHRHVQAPTPWRSIFTSRPVWINALMQFGSVWGNITILTEGPTYLKLILGWDTSATGLFSGLPQVFRMSLSLVYSHYADSLLKSNRIARRTVRIVCGLIANSGFGVALMGIGYSGCNSFAAISFMILGASCCGAISSSTFANLVDLSPNYAGILMGLCGTICITAGFMSPYVAGALIFENQTLQQWKYVFLIAAAVLMASGVQYALFTEVSVQDWNNQSEPFKREEEKLVEDDKIRKGRSYGSLEQR